MSERIKYYGTQTIHGDDAQPLPADAPIRVEFKGGLHSNMRAGDIIHLDQRPQVAYPTGYSLR